MEVGGPSETPDGWQVETLGALGKWLSGGTPSKKRSDFWNGEIPWISAKDMKVPRIFDTIDHVTEEALDNGARTAPAGAVLLVIRGMILAHTLPVALAKRRVAFNQDLKACVLRDGVEGEFLLMWLKSQQSRLLSITSESTHGTKTIPTKALFAEQIALPSPGEQRAIAQVLSDADALIESLQQLLAKKNLISQGIEHDLLTGRRRLEGFESRVRYKESEVGLIPGDWECLRLGDLATKVGSGVTPTGGQRVYKQDGRPFLRSQNVGWGALMLEGVAFIDEQTHSTFGESEIENGDVLLNITGASIGRSAVADSRVQGGNVNQHVCVIRAQQAHLLPSFLNCFLLSTAGQLQIASFQAGGNRQGLNFGQIRSFLLAVPPVAEQRAITELLTTLVDELTALNAKLAITHQIKQGMMQNLLTGKIRLM